MEFDDDHLDKVVEQLLEATKTKGGFMASLQGNEVQSFDDGVILTICPGCAHAWVVVAAVNRSWHCPHCGDGRSEQTRSTRCVCDHAYENHSTVRPRESNDERDFGECRMCECWWYRPSARGPSRDA